MPFQVVSDSSQLVLDRNLQLKSFKPESERKKLDLPVQKNLLTNYFCFASLEAKRNFRAPRVSPKHSSPVANSSLSPDEHIIVEDASRRIDTLLSSPPDSKNNNNSEENDSNSEFREYSKSPSHAMVDEIRSSDHPLLLESGQPIHRPSPASHEESTVLDAAKTKTITESGKVILRSRYFQKKQVTKNDLEDKQVKFCSKGGIANDLPENGNPDSYENTYFKRMTLKRKNSSLECLETENVNPKQIYMDASCDDNGHCDPNLETFVETKAGDSKFGSNISHLGHYSDIAEKSMERFVSVISSFRFSSPGSRASGLRAPLKDAQNTCSNRSSVGMDLNQFAYVPKNKKATLASRRF
ncbi:hypothetical protein REPUB_Repub14bG0104600 [Reevesia pubescens]